MKILVAKFTELSSSGPFEGLAEVNFVVFKCCKVEFVQLVINLVFY